MNNKCVYVHKLNGKVVYVGSGNICRVKMKNCRSRPHLDVWNNLEFEIVSENLSVDESSNLEQELINRYWDSGKLLNKKRYVHSTKKLSFEELNEVLYYDETSPTFLRWKVRISQSVKAGDIAGRVNSNGYIQIGLKRKLYQAHRIIFVLNSREDIPEGFVVDHIDGDKSNNSINNLRIITQSCNSRNKLHRKSNVGFQCISEIPYDKKFVVQFTDIKRTQIYFSYKVDSIRHTKNRYATRELALEAAILVRDMLVDSGKIILTNKEEL